MRQKADIPRVRFERAVARKEVIKLFINRFLKRPQLGVSRLENFFAARLSHVRNRQQTASLSCFLMNSWSVVRSSVGTANAKWLVPVTRTNSAAFYRSNQ